MDETIEFLKNWSHTKPIAFILALITCVGLVFVIPKIMVILFCISMAVMLYCLVHMMLNDDGL